MTRRKRLRRSRFHVCVRGIVLHLAIPADERELDVEEETEKGSSLENEHSAVATFR